MGSRVGKLGPLEALEGAVPSRGVRRAGEADASASFGSFLGVQIASESVEDDNGSPAGTLPPDLLSSGRSPFDFAQDDKVVALSGVEAWAAQKSRRPAGEPLSSSTDSAELLSRAHAPPDDDARRVEALAGSQARIRDAGEMDRQGQLNDIAGHVLDATTARETPAPSGSAKPASLKPGRYEPSLRSVSADARVDLVGSDSTELSGLGFVSPLLANVAPVNAAPGSRTKDADGRVPVRSQTSVRAPDFVSNGVANTLEVNPSFVAGGSSDALPSGNAFSAGDDVANVSDAKPGNDAASSENIVGSRVPSGGSAVGGVSGVDSDLLARMVGRAVRVDAQFAAARGGFADSFGSESVVAASDASALGNRGAAGSAGEHSSASSAGGGVVDLIAAVEAAVDDGASQDAGDGALADDSPADDAPVQQSVVKTAASQDLTSVGMASASPVSFAHAVQTAAASSSGSSVPVDPNAVIEQVVKAMTMRTASDGTSEIRLHLEPEQLGSVTLRLTVNGSSVSATAIAQNPDVHGLLTSHQHQLERSLAESGLKLTSFRVDLSGQDAGTDREGDRSSGFGQRSHVRHVAADAEPDVTERSNDEPAVLSGSALGVRSYLA
jgi:hypothetical protein